MKLRYNIIPRCIFCYGSDVERLIDSLKFYCNDCKKEFRNANYITKEKKEGKIRI